MLSLASAKGELKLVELVDMAASWQFALFPGWILLSNSRFCSVGDSSLVLDCSLLAGFRSLLCSARVTYD